MKSARRFWIVQFISLFLGGLPFLLMPEFVVDFTTSQETAPTEVQMGQVRIIGGVSMGAAFASLLATTNQVLAWQRGMAAIFIVFFLDWSTTLTLNQISGEYKAFVPYGTSYVGYLYAFINFLILAQPGRNEPVARTRTDSMPTRLRWLWAGQGVWYLIEAAVCLLAAEWTLRWVSIPDGPEITNMMAIQQVRIVSAWTLCFALVSIYASLENRIRDWRQYRWFFLIALLARAAGYAIEVQSGYFEPYAAVVVVVPAVLFAWFGFRWTLGAVPTEFREESGLRPLRNADSDAPAPEIAVYRVFWFWMLQATGFFVAGAWLIVAPDTALATFAADIEISAFAADGTRIAGALMVALGFFNVFAVMTAQSVYRRRFAIVFTFHLSFTAIVLWLGMANGLYDDITVVACALLTLFAIPNLKWSLQKPPGYLVQADSGVAGTKPPATFFSWLVQFAILLFIGVSQLLVTQGSLLDLSSGGYQPGEVFDAEYQLIHAQWHLAGIATLALAITTIFAMHSQREHIWRGFAFFGMVAFGVVSLVLLFVVNNERYQEDALWLFAAGVALVLLNRWIRRHPSTWSTDDSRSDIETWTLLDLVAGPLMAVSVMLTRRRSSHLLGAGARGTFRVADREAERSFPDATTYTLDAPAPEPDDKAEITYPKHDFFKPGDEMKIQARFANLTQLDDASLDVRGFSIKFSEHRTESPFDLLMNTGAFCPAYNLLTFASFVASKFLPVSISRLGVKNNLIAREGGVAGLRRAPDSFAHLYYHSQIVRHWIDEEGMRYLVRYRCIPEDAGPESGLPSEDDAQKIWLRERLPDEDRPGGYLRDEICERIESGGVTMRLQAQFRRPRKGDSEDWYNASVEWDEPLCPWVDLGTLELDEVLSEADTELLQFDPSNHPMTLGIPRSGSPLDYRSMGDSEARVVHTLQRFRVWVMGIFGPPSSAPVEGASR